MRTGRGAAAWHNCGNPLRERNRARLEVLRQVKEGE